MLWIICYKLLCLQWKFISHCTTDQWCSITQMIVFCNRTTTSYQILICVSKMLLYFVCFVRHQKRPEFLIFALELILSVYLSRVPFVVSPKDIWSENIFFSKSTFIHSQQQRRYSGLPPNDDLMFAICRGQEAFIIAESNGNHRLWMTKEFVDTRSRVPLQIKEQQWSILGTGHGQRSKSIKESLL